MIPISNHHLNVTQSEAEALTTILTRNYEALGWQLLSLDLLQHSSFAAVLRVKIQCPCGGVEYATMIVDTPLGDNIRNLARNLLSASADKEHLENDVRKGTLLPFDIDHHAFTGELI